MKRRGKRLNKHGESWPWYVSLHLRQSSLETMVWGRLIIKQRPRQHRRRGCSSWYRSPRCLLNPEPSSTRIYCLRSLHSKALAAALIAFIHRETTTRGEGCSPREQPKMPFTWFSSLNLRYRPLFSGPFVFPNEILSREDRSTLHVLQKDRDFCLLTNGIRPAVKTRRQMSRTLP